MNSAHNTSQANLSAAYAKWQKAIAKMHNPLVTPTTAMRYLREAEKAKAAYMQLKNSR